MMFGSREWDFNDSFAASFHVLLWSRGTDFYRCKVRCLLVSNVMWARHIHLLFVSFYSEIPIFSRVMMVYMTCLMISLRWRVVSNLCFSRLTVCYNEIRSFKIINIESKESEVATLSFIGNQSETDTLSYIYIYKNKNRQTYNKL